MEATTRPYEAVPPEAAEVLRPALPGLADETIAAIAREVPDYARAMEGEFGQVVRLGVEVALNRFVDLLAAPEPDAAESRRTYVDLGRGEFHAGRSLDALLAAYRVGARLAWRRFVEAGVDGGLAPDAIYALGEAIFAYIDELSAESAEGYAEEQTAAAGESERRRRRLVRLLAQDPPAGQEAVRTAAAAAAPGRCRAAAWPRSSPRPPTTTRRARRCSTRSRRGSRAGSARARSAPRRSAPRSSSSPTPTRPGRRRRLEARDRRTAPVALGPTVEWQHSCGERSRRAIATQRLAAAGRLTRRPRAGLIVADDHLAHLLLAADPRVAADLAAARLAPLADARRRPARAADRDARRVARPARPGAGRRGGARRAPADRPLPRAPAARPLRRPARRPRRALRAVARAARRDDARCYH